MRNAIRMMTMGVLLVCAGLAPANPCVVPDNGSGTVTLPPQGCEYLYPDEVHKILDGLPPGTTIELAPIHKDFICYRESGQGVCSVLLPPGICEEPGGTLGGQLDCFESHLDMQLTGTGTLAGWTRTVNVPISCEVHTAPRTPGSAVQDFDSDMFRMYGQIVGDPDFDLLRIIGGTNFGLPSPGHTTLTQLGTQWAVDSFFDIEYRIDFVGSPLGPLANMSGSTVATIRMQTGDEQCYPRPDGLGCVQATCASADESCIPRCMNYNPVTGISKVIDCDCRLPNDCHVVPGMPAKAEGRGTPCEVPDNGSGTVTLPPAGCEYLSPDEVHEILAGLPAGTTIELATIHKDFICEQGGTHSSCTLPIPPGWCEMPGGTLGGYGDCFNSTLQMNLTGTGSLAGWNRTVTLPIFTEIHTGPRVPGAAVQDFDAQMFRVFGELPAGDPDFCVLRIKGGADFGMPSPGHTTLTQLPGGNFRVDSFFDVFYQIEFEGCTPSPIGGYSGTTQDHIRMETGFVTPPPPPVCQGGCPSGYECTGTRVYYPDGTFDLCCDCAVCKATLVEAKSWKTHGVAPNAEDFYIPLRIAPPYPAPASPGVETRVGGITWLTFAFDTTGCPPSPGSTGYLKRSDGAVFNPTSATVAGQMLTLKFGPTPAIPNAWRYVCCLQVPNLTGDRDVEVIGQVGNIAQSPPPTLWKTDGGDLSAIGPYTSPPTTATQVNCKYDITQSPPTSRKRIDGSDKTTLAGSYSGPVSSAPLTCP